MGTATDYIEFKIKRSSLGVTSSTDQIRFCMYTEQQWGSYYRYFTFPGSSDLGNRGGSQSLPSYKSFTLGDKRSPISQNLPLMVAQVFVCYHLRYPMVPTAIC